MFRSRSERPIRIPTLIARITLTASVAIAVGAGVANAQQTQPQQGQQSQLTQQQPQPQVSPLPQPQTGQAQPQFQKNQPLSQPGQGGFSGSTVTTQTTVAAPTIVNSTAFANPRTSQILGVPESHCGHVIDLLIRNRMRQQSGAVGAELK
jgi:hypothetical protein